MLIGILCKLMHWFQLVFFCFKMYFMLHLYLVSKSTIGILKILFIYKWYQHLFCQHTIWFHWYHNSFCWLQEISKKIVLKSGFKNLLIYIAYMQGELNISSIYRFMLSVFYTLRSSTSLLYVIHVRRKSLTSPLIHCILCFIWVKV